MAKISPRKSTQSKRNSNDAALDHSDSEEEIEIDDEEVSVAKTKKSKNGKEESSVRVSNDSHAGEKRRPRKRGNGGEDSAHVECIASKRRKESERVRKNAKEKVPEVRRGVEDTERDLKDEVRKPELKKEPDKLIRRSRDGSFEKVKCRDNVKDDNDSRRSSRGEHVKDRIYKDGATCKEKYGEDAGRSYKLVERPLEDEMRIPKLKKELEKQIRRSRDGSVEKWKYKDYVTDDSDGHRSSRGEYAKDRRSKDGASYRDEYGEDADRSNKNEYGEDADRRYKDKHGEDDDRSYKVKHGEDGDRSYKVKHGDYGDRSYKVEYGEDGNRRYKVKHEEDGGRSYKDKYGEDADRSYKVRHREDAGRSYKVKHGEDAERSYNVKYGEDADRGYKDKYGEDTNRDRRHRDSKSREDVDWKKRHWEDRHKDEHAFRDHHGDRSGTKHIRDESNAGGNRYKKSRFDITNYDDGQNTRCLDDREKRADDKEDKIYSRSQSSKEQSDAEKKITTSGMVESVADKEGCDLHCVDADFNASQNRQRSSPSSHSHLEKYQYRHSREAELKSGDSEHEERVRHNLLPLKEVVDVSGVLEQPSLSMPTKRLIDNDDRHLGDLSGEMCLNPDGSSDEHLVDGSKLTKLGNRLIDKDDSHLGELPGERCLNLDAASAVHLVDDSKLTTLGIKESFDSEEFGKMIGVIKDRDPSSTEGNLVQVPLEPPPTGELSREDVNAFSPSPSVRADQISSNSCSNFRPPHHRYNKINSSCVGRVYGNSRNNGRGNARNNGRGNTRNGNSRKTVPIRPSPVINSFTHFHHGAAPVGFHPVMHQFSAFPIYGGRPMMDKHSVFLHHIHDADRFLSHDHSFGWQNSINDSCPPPLHGWDANNSVVRPDSLAYGRVDWNHNTETIGSQPLETNADMWKGPCGGVNPKLPSVLQEKDPAVHTQEDEIWIGDSLQVQNEENQCDILVEKSHGIEIGCNRDALVKEPSKPPNNVAKIPKADDDRLWLVYLSKLDISAELTHPELYKQCLKLMDVEQNESVDEGSLKLLYLEEVEKKQDKLSKLASSASLFVAIDDCVFQKAMSIYKKQREETRDAPLPSLLNIPKASFCSAKNVDFVPNCDREKQPLPILSCSETKRGQLLPTFSAPNVKLSESSPSRVSHKPKMDTNMVPNQEASNVCIDDNRPTTEHASQFAHGSPGHLSRPGNSMGGEHSAGNGEEQKSVDTRCDPIPICKVSDEASEGVMPHSIDSGSVNVSRIHGAFEITL